MIGNLIEIGNLKTLKNWTAPTIHRWKHESSRKSVCKWHHKKLPPKKWENWKTWKTCKQTRKEWNGLLLQTEKQKKTCSAKNEEHMENRGNTAKNCKQYVRLLKIQNLYKIFFFNIKNQSFPNEQKNCLKIVRTN